MEELPSGKLDPRVKNVWRINDAIWIALGSLSCIIPFAIVGAFEPLDWIFVVLIIEIAVSLGLFILFLVVLPPLRYIRWRYHLSEDYLDIAKGIIWRKRYIIPFIRVQNTDTRQGPILRLFSLASVTVATAAGEHEIPGLRMDVAEQLRDKAAELARLAREDL